MSISRRTFLQTTAVSGLAANALSGAEVGKSAIPTRILGRTGARVSILAFGCGSKFLSYKDPDKAVEVLTHALDLGITYVDTAYSYGNGTSEEWVGRAIKGRRDNLWLTTKVGKRDADGAMKIIEGSLKRLQTDHVDLIHIHSLQGEDDLAAIEAPDGVLKLLYKLRDQKVTRAVGITCHNDPHMLKKALERGDFDVTQMALNAARVGMKNVPGGMGINPDMHTSFELIALPVATKKKMGVIAMKVFAQDGLAGKAAPEKLLRYCLSLPVTAAVVGMPKPELIDVNVGLAKSFRPLPAGEMRDLSDQLSSQYKAELDQFFAGHVDC